jgi:hypothetical protein
MEVLKRLLACAILILIAAACAHHPARMTEVRTLMAREQYDQALAEFDRCGGSEEDVLYLLERALLLHYTGMHAASNEMFERAEILAEDLYTKSISRELASLVTSDLVLEYVPKPFEQILINYFRALNYMFMGQKEDALVECRKAGDKLALYSEEDKRPYRRDAFIEYLTGILYEWDGEINDAFISYRNAIDSYDTYRSRFGIASPEELTCDVRRTAEILGFVEDTEDVPTFGRQGCEPGSTGGAFAKVVVFIEQGFVPPRQELAANIPILKSEAKKSQEDPYKFSLGLHSRLYGHTFDADDIDYFLRVAIPVYPDHNGLLVKPTLYLDSLMVLPELAEDVFAIAKAEYTHDLPKLFAKTLARTLIKYQMTDMVENKWGKLAGRLANVATAATERADLRGWLSLPWAIHVAVIYVDTGSYDLTLESPGATPETSLQTVRLDLEEDTTNFVRFRAY